VLSNAKDLETKLILNLLLNRTLAITGGKAEAKRMFWNTVHGLVRLFEL
jgi:hypothetical protein